MAASILVRPSGSFSFMLPEQSTTSAKFWTSSRLMRFFWSASISEADAPAAVSWARWSALRVKTVAPHFSRTTVGSGSSRTRRSRSSNRLTSAGAAEAISSRGSASKRPARRRGKDIGHSPQVRVDRPLREKGRVAVAASQSRPVFSTQARVEASLRQAIRRFFGRLAAFGRVGRSTRPCAGRGPPAPSDRGAATNIDWP